MADDAVMRLLDEIADIGRDPDTGGYRRFAWSQADLQLRKWFTGQAQARRMEVTEDGNGNLFARRGQARAVMMGSHLDSVPDGEPSTVRSESCRPSRPPIVWGPTCP